MKPQAIPESTSARSTGASSPRFSRWKSDASSSAGKAMVKTCSNASSSSVQVFTVS